MLEESGKWFGGFWVEKEHGEGPKVLALELEPSSAAHLYADWGHFHH